MLCDKLHSRTKGIEVTSVGSGRWLQSKEGAARASPHRNRPLLGVLPWPALQEGRVLGGHVWAGRSRTSILVHDTKERAHSSEISQHLRHHL